MERKRRKHRQEGLSKLNFSFLAWGLQVLWHFVTVLGNARWSITCFQFFTWSLSFRHLYECGSHYGPRREMSLHSELCPQKGSFRKASETHSPYR